MNQHGKPMPILPLAILALTVLPLVVVALGLEVGLW